MRAKIGISIACCSVLSVVLCGAAILRAQAPPPPAPAGPTTSIQDSENDLSVAVGKTVLVDCTWPIARVAVGLGDIAEVHATSPTEIMVQGKSLGETSLIIWDTHGGRQFFNVTVRASVSAQNDNLDAVRRELRTELPGESLKVSYENGSIFLRGTVKNLNNSERAVKIASIGLGSKDGKVINLLNVAVPASDPQILLKVKFISVDRSKEAKLGLNFFNTGAANLVGGITTGQFSPPTVTLPSATGSASATVSNGLNISAFNPALGLGVTIQALETKVGAQVLAEPNLMAANGKQASFLAGGEFPYPMVQGGGAGTASSITIMFKEYGVRLNFIPTITPRGTIRLQVAPEVSALDFTNAVQISGFDVPAITSRKVKTEVELADGQSFVIGGLLDNTESETFQKIPFLGDIPILGKFFQSMDKTKANTELIVIVTPEIVAPIPAGDTLPSLKFPGKFLAPNTTTPLNNPDAKTAANTLPSAPPSMPVEKLVESMRPGPQLVIEGATGTFGGASGASSSSAAPASQQQ